jgi:hypothetical protein
MKQTLMKESKMPIAIVEKYGATRLPRYTSYPTAPAFSSLLALAHTEIGWTLWTTTN